MLLSRTRVGDKNGHPFKAAPYQFSTKNLD